MSNQPAGSLESVVGPARPILTNWISALKLDWPQDKLGGSARIKGLSGAIISVAIGSGAIFALTHALNNVDYSQVFEIIRATDFSVIAVALMLVTASYGSITLYDWLALHTMGRKDVPYRIAALASLTRYPIAHGIGAVALISPVIRYRIYSGNGLGAMGVANICFLTGLTFWLGNMTALGFSLLYEPGSPDVPRFLYHLVPLSIALGHGGASASKHQSRTEAQTGELSLSPTIPATINVRQTMRTGSVGSL